MSFNIPYFHLYFQVNFAALGKFYYTEKCDTNKHQQVAALIVSQ